ncbi:MAG: shikimate kinase, partial [Actinomycetota bacterium]
ACGGGAVLDPANVHVLRRSGVIVYLRVSPAVAAARVGDGAGRPLLAGDDPAGRLAAVIEERSDAYQAAADVTVDADQPAAAVADAVVGATGAAKGMDR